MWLLNLHTCILLPDKSHLSPPLRNWYFYNATYSVKCFLFCSVLIRSFPHNTINHTKFSGRPYSDRVCVGGWGEWLWGKSGSMRPDSSLYRRGISGEKRETHTLTGLFFYFRANIVHNHTCLMSRIAWLYYGWLLRAFLLNFLTGMGWCVYESSIFRYISKGRTLVIVTILVVSAIVAIGLGLGLGLRKRNDETHDANSNGCPQQVTGQQSTLTTQTPTTTSPLYNPPSDSKEGRYRFAAVAADAEECSQIGT